jgi:starch synthase
MAKKKSDLSPSDDVPFEASQPSGKAKPAPRARKAQAPGTDKLASARTVKPRARAASVKRPGAVEAADAAAVASPTPAVPRRPRTSRQKAATLATVSPPIAAAAAVETPAPSAPEARVRIAERREDALTILMIASEAVPFAKTGGLADVARALPLALGRLGHQVILALPRYRGIGVTRDPLLTLAIQLGQRQHTVRVYEQPLGPNARAWLVDEPALYDREGLYSTSDGDHPDNPRRYGLLARAALEGVRAAGIRPDVLHAHDWQGGLAPVYLKTRYARDPMLGGLPSVFTIHNIAYQGRCDPTWLPELDLGWDLFRPEALEFWYQVSLLKAGIVFSEKITTVSPRYAQEILTPEFAFGFEGVVAARRHDLVGILNGTDTETWNPAADPFIPRPYTAADRSGKIAAKRALLDAYGLPSDEAAIRTPLVGQVSRMIDQKGLDLIAQVAGDLPHTGARFVVLGTGEPRYEQMWRSLADAFPDRISARIGFDEPLSHLIEAGADLFLMPSRFEPCGLNQMYSLRYGTLPLVRATGGLDDTVENYDPYTGRGNGFKFWEPSGPALLATLQWALRVYEHPEVWDRLQSAAMAGDFSWDRSARDYTALYTAIVRPRPRP